MCISEAPADRRTNQRCIRDGFGGLLLFLLMTLLGGRLLITRFACRCFVASGFCRRHPPPKAPPRMGYYDSRKAWHSAIALLILGNYIVCLHMISSSSKLQHSLSIQTSVRQAFSIESDPMMPERLEISLSAYPDGPVLSFTDPSPVHTPNSSLLRR